MYKFICANLTKSRSSITNFTNTYKKVAQNQNFHQVTNATSVPNEEVEENVELNEEDLENNCLIENKEKARAINDGLLLCPKISDSSKSLRPETTHKFRDYSKFYTGNLLIKDPLHSTAISKKYFHVYSICPTKRFYSSNGKKFFNENALKYYQRAMQQVNSIQKNKAGSQFKVNSLKSSPSNSIVAKKSKNKAKTEKVQISFPTHTIKHNLKVHKRYRIREGSAERTIRDLEEQIQKKKSQFKDQKKIKRITYPMLANRYQQKTKSAHDQTEGKILDKSPKLVPTVLKNPSKSQKTKEYSDEEIEMPQNTVKKPTLSIKTHPTMQTASREVQMKLKTKFIQLLLKTARGTKPHVQEAVSSRFLEKDSAVEDNEETHDGTDELMPDSKVPRQDENLLESPQIQSHPSSISKQETDDLKVRYPKRVWVDLSNSYEIDKVCIKDNTGKVMGQPGFGGQEPKLNYQNLEREAHELSNFVEKLKSLKEKTDLKKVFVRPENNLKKNENTEPMLVNEVKKVSRTRHPEAKAFKIADADTGINKEIELIEENMKNLQSMAKIKENVTVSKDTLDPNEFEDMNVIALKKKEKAEKIKNILERELIKEEKKSLNLKNYIDRQENLERMSRKNKKSAEGIREKLKRDWAVKKELEGIRTKRHSSKNILRTEQVDAQLKDTYEEDNRLENKELAQETGHEINERTKRIETIYLQPSFRVDDKIEKITPGESLKKQVKEDQEVQLKKEAKEKTLEGPNKYEELNKVALQKEVLAHTKKRKGQEIIDRQLEREKHYSQSSMRSTFEETPRVDKVVDVLREKALIGDKVKEQIERLSPDRKHTWKDEINRAMSLSKYKNEHREMLAGEKKYNELKTLTKKRENSPNAIKNQRQDTKIDINIAHNKDDISVKQVFEKKEAQDIYKKKQDQLFELKVANNNVQENAGMRKTFKQIIDENSTSVDVGVDLATISAMKTTKAIDKKEEQYSQNDKPILAAVESTNDIVKIDLKLPLPKNKTSLEQNDLVIREEPLNKEIDLVKNDEGKHKEISLQVICPKKDEVVLTPNAEKSVIKIVEDLDKNFRKITKILFDGRKEQSKKDSLKSNLEDLGNEHKIPEKEDCNKKLLEQLQVIFDEKVLPATQESVFLPKQALLIDKEESHNKNNNFETEEIKPVILEEQLEQTEVWKNVQKTSGNVEEALMNVEDTNEKLLERAMQIKKDFAENNDTIFENVEKIDEMIKKIKELESMLLEEKSVKTRDVNFENKPRLPPMPKNPPPGKKKDKNDKPRGQKDMVLPPRIKTSDPAIPENSFTEHCKKDVENLDRFNPKETNIGNCFAKKRDTFNDNQQCLGKVEVGNEDKFEIEIRMIGKPSHIEKFLEGKERFGVDKEENYFRSNKVRGDDQIENLGENQNTAFEEFNKSTNIEKAETKNEEEKKTFAQKEDKTIEEVYFKPNKVHKKGLKPNIAENPSIPLKVEIMLSPETSAKKNTSAPELLTSANTKADYEQKANEEHWQRLNTDKEKENVATGKTSFENKEDGAKFSSMHMTSHPKVRKPGLEKEKSTPELQKLKKSIFKGRSNQEITLKDLQSTLEKDFESSKEEQMQERTQSWPSVQKSVDSTPTTQKLTEYLFKFKSNIIEESDYQMTQKALEGTKCPPIKESRDDGKTDCFQKKSTPELERLKECRSKEKGFQKEVSGKDKVQEKTKSCPPIQTSLDDDKKDCSQKKSSPDLKKLKESISKSKDNNLAAAFKAPVKKDFCRKDGDNTDEKTSAQFKKLKECMDNRNKQDVKTDKMAQGKGSHKGMGGNACQEGKKSLERTNSCPPTLKTSEDPCKKIGESVKKDTSGKDGDNIDGKTSVQFKKLKECLDNRHKQDVKTDKKTHGKGSHKEMGGTGNISQEEKKSLQRTNSCPPTLKTSEDPCKKIGEPVKKDTCGKDGDNIDGKTSAQFKKLKECLDNRNKPDVKTDKKTQGKGSHKEMGGTGNVSQEKKSLERTNSCPPTLKTSEDPCKKIGEPVKKDTCGKDGDNIDGKTSAQFKKLKECLDNRNKPDVKTDKKTQGKGSHKEMGGTGNVSQEKNSLERTNSCPPTLKTSEDPCKKIGEPVKKDTCGKDGDNIDGKTSAQFKKLKECLDNRNKPDVKTDKKTQGKGSHKKMGGTGNVSQEEKKSLERTDSCPPTLKTSEDPCKKIGEPVKKDICGKDGDNSDGKTSAQFKKLKECLDNRNKPDVKTDKKTQGKGSHKEMGGTGNVSQEKKSLERTNSCPPTLKTSEDPCKKIGEPVKKDTCGKDGDNIDGKTSAQFKKLKECLDNRNKPDVKTDKKTQGKQTHKEMGGNGKAGQKKSLKRTNSCPPAQNSLIDACKKIFKESGDNKICEPVPSCGKDGDNTGNGKTSAQLKKLKECLNNKDQDVKTTTDKKEQSKGSHKGTSVSCSSKEDPLKKDRCGGPI